MKRKWTVFTAHIPPLLAFICLAVTFLVVMLNKYQTSGYVSATAPAAPAYILWPEDLPYPEDGIAPNTATAEELDLLPGVGEVISQAFIDEREKNGPFGYPEDLLQIKGIGEKKLEGIRNLIKLP